MTVEHTHRPDQSYNLPPAPITGGLDHPSGPMPVVLERTESRFSTKTKAVVGAVAAFATLGAGAGLFGIYEGAKSTTQRTIEALGNDTPSTSAPEVPGATAAPTGPLESVSPGEFYDKSAATRLDYVYDHFDMDQERTNALKTMKKWLTPQQTEIMDAGVPAGDKATWAAADIRRDVTLREWAMSRLESDETPTGDQPISLQNHLKGFSTVISPEHPEFKRTVEKIGFDKGALLSISTVQNPYQKIDTGSLPFSDGSGRTHNFTGILTQVISEEDPSDGSQGVAVYELIKTPNGNEDWLCIDRYTPEQAGMVNDILVTLPPANESAY